MSGDPTSPSVNANTGSSGLDPELRKISAVVVLGAIMSILDTTIVNVAIDSLGRDLHSSLPTIQWVSTGYLLALSIVIPITGWATERFGTKRAWMLSLTLFIAGSVLCGLAWSPGSLIFFRVLQGLGGGMILPLAQTILAQAAGPQKMGRAMSIIGVPLMLGPVLGPVIGGFIVDDFSWRWIFYVNVPIGLIALPLAQRVLAQDKPQGRERLDIVGLSLLSPGLGLLVYGLSQAGSHGTLTSPSTLVGMGCGAVLVAVFVVYALRTRVKPLLDVRLFFNRHFSAAAGTSFLFGISLFGAMLLLPLYYQVVRGENALNAGLLLAPQGVGAGIGMAVAGRLTDRLGAGRVVPVGLCFALLGTVAYAGVGADTSYVLLAGSLVLRGLGLGATMMPAMAAAYQTLDRSQVPRAAPTLNIVQRVGGSIGTALLAVVLTRFISSDLPGATGGLAAQASQAPSAAARTHVAVPLSHAFASTFWVAFALTAVAFIPALFLPRRPPSQSTGPPEAVATQLAEDVQPVSVAAGSQGPQSAN